MFESILSIARYLAAVTIGCVAVLALIFGIKYGLLAEWGIAGLCVISFFLVFILSMVIFDA